MRLLSHSLPDFITKLNLGNVSASHKIKHLDFAKALGDEVKNTEERLKHNQLKRFYKQLIANRLELHKSKIFIESYFVNEEGLLVFFHRLRKKTRLEKHPGVTIYSWLFETAQPEHPLWLKPKVIAHLASPQTFQTQFDQYQPQDIADSLSFKQWELERVMWLLSTRSESQAWQFLSLVKHQHNYWSFWWLPGNGVFAKIYPNYLISGEIAVRHALPLLTKPKDNPILKPNDKNAWEAFNTFNPAAFYAADKIHILYRAQGHDYISTIGYASSADGINIDKRLQQPIYYPTESFEGKYMPPGNPTGEYVSGGGVGGCEDPRVTLIEEKLYMTYVAYDGWSPPRVALTSIALSDFLAERFLWEKPVLISPPGVVDKSACIFPEKINGKYVIMHRIFPNILIDFVDSLDYDGTRFLKGERKIGPRTREWWDSRKVGAGAPPLKTDKGWLLIYQAVDDKDGGQYKVGAMLLDLQDPSIVLARSSKPIMEPRETYENAGFKAGVIYPCGAVIRHGELLVYYGGADSYVCVATAPLEQFISNLLTTGTPNIHPSQIGISI